MRQFQKVSPRVSAPIMTITNAANVARPLLAKVTVVVARNNTETPANTKPKAVFGTIVGRPGKMLLSTATSKVQPVNTTIPMRNTIPPAARANHFGQRRDLASTCAPAPRSRSDSTAEICRTLRVVTRRFWFTDCRIGGDIANGSRLVFDPATVRLMTGVWLSCSAKTWASDLDPDLTILLAKNNRHFQRAWHAEPKLKTGWRIQRLNRVLSIALLLAMPFAADAGKSYSGGGGRSYS